MNPAAIKLAALICACPPVLGTGAVIVSPKARHYVAHHVAAFAHRYEVSRPAPVKPLDCGIGAAIGPSVGGNSIPAAAGVAGVNAFNVIDISPVMAPLVATPAADAFTAGPARGPYIGGTTPASLVPDAGQPIAPVTVTPVSGVPEVATWVTLVAGFAAVGLRARAGRRVAV